MRFVNGWLLLAVFGGLCRYGQATCVLESDFGFVINCAFKKSGLFRVRNLGGVKAHIGLGFSVGDELGFRQSLTNVEGNLRRSASASPFVAQAALAQQARKANHQSNTSRSSQNSLPHNSPQKANKLYTSTVPPFKPIPPAPERPIVSNATKTLSKKEIPSPMSMGIAVPAFNSMPSSISRISHEPESKPAPQIAIIMPVKKQANDKMSSTFALRTLPTEDQNNFPNPIAQPSTNYIHNISESALEEAIMQRQTTTTTMKPSTTKTRYYKHSTIGKVMNAPKEYYPVGYDKNFDDNFSSRVDLPETSFRCGDQKHFPGLYADEDLGCMVFHVCALTDDGLIMKSFLCPESTLFDQTILKCNWWFYVDCKNSKKLYDSNIPISKSYQLMKALTFFSSYKKESQNNNSQEVINKSTVTKD